MCFQTICTEKHSTGNPLIKKQTKNYLPLQRKNWRPCICNCQKSFLLIWINCSLINISKMTSNSYEKQRTHIPFSVSFLTQKWRPKWYRQTKSSQSAPPEQVKFMQEFLYFYTWIKDLLFAIPFQTCSAEFLAFLVSQCDRNQQQSVSQKVVTGTWPSFILQRDNVS